MITAGIDAGFENIKVAILDGGNILAKGEASSFEEGGRRAESIEKIWKETLNAAGLSESDIVSVASTGQGKYDVVFSDKNVVEAVADARGGRFFSEDAAFVVDIGADTTRVLTLATSTETRIAIDEVVFNQKCAAGIGTMLEFLTRRLEMTLDEMSALPAEAASDVIVNDGCPVFTELGVLELLNAGVSARAAAGAAIQALAVRVHSVLNDKVIPAKDSTVLLGGVAKNTAFVNTLKMESGIQFITPENAEYGGAIGAALIAGDECGEKE
jgi:predicted CoA-substrate-specific enzyme activase